ncbi:keratin 99 [Hoplias malabaricus]|uniref:keratin 99 n=1 Tax=Hoplias malabaricus TaxID=27720 RepID=UPI003462FFC9
MPVALKRSSSFTSLSAVGSGFHSSTGGMVLNGNSSIFDAYSGYGTRISSSSSLGSSYDVSFGANEKLTMQNLNNRLASYLEKVRSLEASNRKIELRIKDYYESMSPVGRKDLTGYYSTIESLRKQIIARAMENAQIHLQLDNTNLACSDFKMKYEVEMNMRLAIEADLARLRRALGEMKLSQNNLELQMAGLQEELVYLKKTHEEEIHALRAQQSGSVDVQVDSGPSVSFEKVMEEMREQYELLIQKYRKDAEHWFHSKAESLKSQVSTSCTEIKTSQTVITDLNGKYQNLKIELDAAHMQNQVMETNVSDVAKRYSAQLSELQLRIYHLQEELQQINVSISQQSSEYQLLLDIKMRLEQEIAEYRRLLEGEESISCKSTTVTETVTETVTDSVTETVTIQEEEHNPHVQRRVKVIVEELVDGKVVSSSVEEKVQELS